MSRDQFDFFDLFFNLFEEERITFWLAQGLNRLSCVTCQIRGDSKLIAPLRPKVVWGMKNSYEIMH